MAPPLLVFDAEATLFSSGGERIASVDSLFAGLRKNALRRGELIKEFLLPRFEGISYFRKVGRTGDDLAVTSMAISASSDLKIALGSATAVPMRARNTERALGSGMEEACNVLLSETDPRSSIRASAGYRKKLEVELLKECLREVGL
jgi:CO/xanthine dehydrogenase FAD-binding subunit